MALTVGGSPITPEQLATLQADLGIVVAEEITDRLTSLVSTDDTIFLRAGVPYLASAGVISDYVGVISGAQTLTPARFNNSQTFYAATLTGGAVVLTPSRFDNAQSFYSPTVFGDGVQTLTPARFDNSQTFYAPTVELIGAGETFVRFSTLVDMTETGNGTTGWIYTGTVVEGYAGGSDYTLASGVAGGVTVDTGLGGNTPSPLLGFYTNTTGVWNDSFHVIAYPFFFGGGPEWQFNGPGFTDLVTTVRLYVDGDRVRIRFDSANGVVGEIARAAAPDTWLQIGAGTVTRSVTLYPRLHAHDGAGSGATAVFTAPFVSP